MHDPLNVKLENSYIIIINTNIQGVPGGMEKTSGECSLC